MGILADGGALVENLVPAGLMTAASKIVEAPSGLATVATRLVEAIAINSVWERSVASHLRGEAPEPSQRAVGRPHQPLFSVANLPIRFWSKLDDWRRSEVDCFEMLNGDRFHAYVSGKRCVVAEKLPGESLWEYLNPGTLTCAGSKRPRSV